MSDDAREKQPKRPPGGDHAPNGQGLDSETRRHIGRMLKATYDEVAHEPVPSKFLDLLKQLEAAEPRKR
jgi:hypothetical protein